MARPYSDDLRRKFLEAHEQREGSLTELAERFHVSTGWAMKVSAAFARTGNKERPTAQRRGRKSRISSEAVEDLRLLVKTSPDRTLTELQEDLRSRQGIEIGVTRLWSVLRQTGIRPGRRRSTRT